jgi:hypothetical protein
MKEVDVGGLPAFFLAELLRYFSNLESEIKTDEPTGEDYLEVVFEEKVNCQRIFLEMRTRVKAFSVSEYKISLRGRAVFLELRRRRWRHKEAGEHVFPPIAATLS